MTKINFLAIFLLRIDKNNKKPFYHYQNVAAPRQYQIQIYLSLVLIANFE